ncbi:PLDc N-terminal domain-containing protein [Litoribacter populi]|uniref:PLDc N-terminal domain-containing protein n=1 Tax=Litoribacter populi TaxID=2598460 RepID=UPI0011801E11
METFYHSLSAVVILGIVYVLFWIVTIVHAARAKYRDDISRAIWIFIIVIFQVVGPILYWIFSRENKISDN